MLPVLIGGAALVSSFLGRREKRVDLSPMIENHQRQMEELKKEMAAAGERRNAEFQAKLAATIKQFENDRKKMEDANEALMGQINKLQADLDRPIRDRKRKVEFVNQLRLEPRMTNKKVIVGQKGDGKSTFLWLWGKGPQPQRSASDGTTSLLDRGDFIDTIGLPAWDVYYVGKLLVLLMDFMMPADIIICLKGDRIAHALTSLSNYGILAPLVVILDPAKLYTGLGPSTDIFTGEALPAVLEYKEVNGVKVFRQNQLREIYSADAMMFVRRSGLGTCISHQDPPATAAATLQRDYHPFAHFTFPFEVTEAPMESSKELLFRFTEIYHRKYKGRPEGQLLFLNKATIAEFEEAL